MYKVASKLFLLGEYAITKPNSKAIILSIPKYTYANIESSGRHLITSSLFNYTVDLNSNDENYSLILETIHFIHRYLIEQQITIKPYHINISSELYFENQKYGLGSSGAIVVLLAKAILGYHNIFFNSLTLFKFCAVFLTLKNDNGSFGDIACIAFNQHVIYHQFDRTFIHKEKPIDILLQNNFNTLRIIPYYLKFPYHFFVIWSKVYANSSNFIKKITVTPSFVENSNALVNQCINCTQSQFISIIYQSRVLLNTLSNEIEILPLKNICDIFGNYGGIAKSSGAGGGDCAIGFCFDEQSHKLIKQQLTYPIIMEEIYE